MGVASSASRRSETAPLTAQVKRSKMPKSQSRYVSATPNPTLAAKNKRDKKEKMNDKIKPKPFGPGTRPGAHQELPITIESDDESDSADLMETTASDASAAIRYEAVLEMPPSQS